MATGTKFSPDSVTTGERDTAEDPHSHVQSSGETNTTCGSSMHLGDIGPRAKRGVEVDVEEERNEEEKQKEVKAKWRKSSTLKRWLLQWILPFSSLFSSSTPTSSSRVKSLVLPFSLVLCVILLLSLKSTLEQRSSTSAGAEGTGLQSVDEKKSSDPEENPDSAASQHGQKKINRRINGEKEEAGKYGGMMGDWREKANQIYELNMRKRRETLCNATTVAELQSSSCIQHKVREHNSNFLNYILGTFLVPTFPCPIMEKLGGFASGGKWICHVEGLLPKRPVVYSIGSYGEITFEEDVHERLHVKSFTFDPFLTDEQKKVVVDAPFINWVNAGLRGITRDADDVDKSESSYSGPKMMTILEAMKMFKHDFIDLFKIDCESCEVGVIGTLPSVFDKEKPLFGQIQMEVHSLDNYITLLGVLITTENLGYRLFHAEQVFDCPQCYELAYIHETLVS